MPTIGETAQTTLHRALRRSGLCIDLGAATVRVRAAIESFVPQLRAAYRNFPFEADAPFCDIHVELRRPRGLRRFVRPQAVFMLDGLRPFESYPADSALPLFEWGVNWSISARLNQHLLLHAGTVERDGNAIILAAVPGAGKSTLTAALMLSGYRLLSDEFGCVRLDSGELLALLKPVALKNQSIGVIRAFSSAARIGPTFTGTRKGDVAHLAPDPGSVALRHRPAVPAVILFPRYEIGADLLAQPMSATQAFARLAFNSFNYHLLGPDGFQTVADLVQQCPAFELRYGSLHDAIAEIDRLLLSATDSHAPAPAGTIAPVWNPDSGLA